MDVIQVLKMLAKGYHLMMLWTKNVVIPSGGSWQCGQINMIIKA